MTRWLIPGAALFASASALLSPPPVHAQIANGVLVIYGDDKCPTDKNGNEIVVCARRPETERYRIPKELRDLQIKPENRSWVTKVVDPGRPDVGSCSAVGQSGFTGCTQNMIDQAKRERRQRSQTAQPGG